MMYNTKTAMGNRRQTCRSGFFAGYPLRYLRDLLVRNLPPTRRLQIGVETHRSR